MIARQVTAMARADFLQRVRGTGYLLTLGATAWIGSLVYTDNIQMWVGDFRGVPNAAWLGTVVALAVTTFVSLAGFYVVKDTIERDRRTGVGQILAATSVSTPAYLLAKWLSNALVLGTIVMALAVVAFVLRVAQGPLWLADAAPLLMPLVLLAAPALCVVAAVAVVFEVVPSLAGGLGNVLFVACWGTALIVPLATGQPWADWSGIGVVDASLAAAVHRVSPASSASISFTMGPAKDLSLLTPLDWPGVVWSTAAVLARLAWLLVAILLVVVAAPVFDRFDTLRASAPRRWARRRARPQWFPRLRSLGVSSGDVWWPWVDRIAAMAGPVGTMAAAELRLAVRDASVWWFVVALGLVVASAVSPLPVARYVHRVAWFWPVLLWAKMGVREAQHRTGPLIFSCPRPLGRQFFGLWVSGVLVAAATGVGFATRMAVAGDAAGWGAWLAGACFIPSLALALGVWTTSTRAFEAVYTLWWYIGPMKGIAALDFTGGSASPERGVLALVYACASVGLIVLAWFGRRKQMQ